MLSSLQQITREIDFETPTILKALAEAHRYLGELKGVFASIHKGVFINNPHQDMLIFTLSSLEAQASSAIESIITTQDALYKYRLHPNDKDSSAKEVHFYAGELNYGFFSLGRHRPIDMILITDIQKIIVGNDAGLRKQLGTKVVNQRTGEVMYVPPEPSELQPLLNDLEAFINDPSISRLDPLIKMASIHHQFESIHPFADGNGRTGRILNILYLLQQGLLDAPILYLSCYINQTKGEYYHLLQTARDSKEQWKKWVVYMLEGVALTAQNTIVLIQKINYLRYAQKRHIRFQYPRIYSQVLLNSLFQRPYTKIQFLMEDLNISRPTATRYLDTLAKGGILRKARLGRESYYINTELTDLLFDIPDIRRANVADDHENSCESH